MTHEIEMRTPAKLSVSLHKVLLDQSDKLELKKDENFIPKPILQGNGSFDIILEIYDFKYELMTFCN